jgi:BirA family biotin operon repressor/biotin-[acetyl-CoA-carboxylase] ligase
MKKIYLSSVDSTNTYAKEHSDEFPKDQITCVFADEQTAGRGRYQRKWISPKGVNVYATLYFVLPIQTPHLISLSQLMAYSFTSILIQEGLSPKIKWPNDVQLNGKKLSGILCETRFGKEAVEIFLGVGINVNLDQKGAKAIDQPATSLWMETNKTWDRMALLDQLIEKFSLHLEIFKKEGFTPFHKQFESLLAYKNEIIRCFDGKKEWVGTFHSLTEDGQLNLLLPDQTIHKIITADVA